MQEHEDLEDDQPPAVGKDKAAETEPLEPAAETEAEPEAEAADKTWLEWQERDDGWSSSE